MSLFPCVLLTLLTAGIHFKFKRLGFCNLLLIIVIYDVSVKSEILFCKWGRLGNEHSELTNPTNKIKSLLTRPSYIYFLYNWFALH
jgi:hypothetical protein